MADAWLRRAPHALSLMRVAFTLATYPFALRQDRAAFAVLVLLAVLTDILDGPLARATGSASRFGANLDSAADLIFYISLPVWAALFRRDLVQDNLALVVAVAAMYVIANLVSQYTFGALGVHNRLSRLSGTVGVATTFYAILWGLPWELKALLLVVLVADLVQRWAAVFRHWMRKRGPPTRVSDT